MRCKTCFALLGVGILGCPSDSGTPPPPPPPPPAVVRSVSVGPSGSSVKVGNTLQMTATVDADAGVATTVTWRSATLTIATVNAGTGLVTGVGAGSVAITACSTAAGFTTVCGSTPVQVTALVPAAVQLMGATWVPPAGPTGCAPGAGPAVPIAPTTQVRCQINVTVQTDPGDQQLVRVDLLINGQIISSGSGSALRGEAEPAGATKRISAAPTVVILSTNTAQLRKNGGIFVPVVFNGNSAITANLYVLGSAAPIASNAIPVVMNNEDAVVPNPRLTLTPLTSVPSATDAGGKTWFTGSLTVTGLNYIAFGRSVPLSVTVNSSSCGPSSSVVTGTATTGIDLSGIFDCAGVESSNRATGLGNVAFPPGAAGPDGTPLVPPTFLSGTGSAFQVPIDAAGTLENRWNMISAPADVFDDDESMDNLAPRVVLVTGPQAVSAMGFTALDLTYNTGNFAAHTIIDLLLISGGATMAAHPGFCSSAHLHNAITIFNVATLFSEGPFTDPWTDGRNDQCGHGILVNATRASLPFPATGGITDALLQSATVSVYKPTGSCDPGQIVDDVLALLGTGPGQVNSPTQNIFPTAGNFNAPFTVFGGTGFVSTDFCLRVAGTDAFGRQTLVVTPFRVAQ